MVTEEMVVKGAVEELVALVVLGQPQVPTKRVMVVMAVAEVGVVMVAVVAAEGGVLQFYSRALIPPE